jgi:hypothetical protein
MPQQKGLIVTSDHARKFDRFRHVERRSEALTVVSGRDLPDGFAAGEWTKLQTVAEMDLSAFEMAAITAHGYAYKKSHRISVAERGRAIHPKSQREQ